MPKPIPYSAAERAWIKTHCTDPRREMCAAFNAKFNRNIALKNINSLCKREGWLTGRNGRFAPGNVPPNKGQKGFCAPGSEKGWFKKGDVPVNVKPFGHERINSGDGHVLIKIDMEHPYKPGHRGYYVYKARYLYEQENGPIPEGMVLRCLDGDKQNFELSNWELISKGLNARLNQRGYNDVPEAFKPAALTSAKLVDKIGRLKSGGQI